jgi:hypothetical protein
VSMQIKKPNNAIIKKKKERNQTMPVCKSHEGLPLQRRQL